MMSKFKNGDNVFYKTRPAVVIYVSHYNLCGLHSQNIYDIKFSSGEQKAVLEEEISFEAENSEAPLNVQYTGGSSNYYKVFVQNPTTLAEPYEAECNDIIEALKMTFAEGNAFKAIWRKAKARQGVQKKGYDNGLYDSEKVVFFGERMVVEAKSGEDK